MQAEFWLDKWSRKEIGFHRKEVNPFLAAHLQALALAPGARIFVPLCGKTLDIGWLRQQGYEVVGCELSEQAVQELFAELGQTPDISPQGQHIRYCADGVEILVGDIFELSAEFLGRVDAIYDRAALIALPEQMRQQYANHLRAITRKAPQLLITLSYDQQLISGPPFSVTQEDVAQLYSAYDQIQQLEKLVLEKGLKGQFPMEELVWLLN